jgi:hypothetical protein
VNSHEAATEIRASMCCDSSYGETMAMRIVAKRSNSVKVQSAPSGRKMIGPLRR